MPSKSSTNIIDQSITDTLEKNYMPYTMSSIVSRAIPEIDGFKPSHRKLLYTMYKMGLLKGGRRKSADVVGQTMQLNPHGDAAIYETMVRLTRGYDALLHPFIDSKGNFGKVFSRDMAYAASRYTEVKLSSICEELFNDIDKNTVNFIDNYNGKLKEPLLFPTTYPNLLVNANQGIAVGMASSVSGFNLKEVINTTIAYINSKETDISKYLLAPDFSTGGELIYDKAEIKKIYETGKGSVRLRSKYRYDKKNSCIEVYEIPYTTTCEAIIDKIFDLVKAGKFKEINYVRDETDLSGLKITIDIKRSADPDALMRRLFQATSLTDSFICNFNVLIDGRPVTLGIKGILDAWLSFRTDCIKRSLIFDLSKNREKLHLLFGLSKIIVDIDRAIAIIRSTEQDSLVIPNLMEGFDIDRVQAEYVAEIRLRNLNKEYLLNHIGEKTKLENDIARIEETLKSGSKINKIIETQLKDISKRYGKPRLTDIIYDDSAAVIDTDDVVDDYPVKIFMTRQNYFKKIPALSLKGTPEQNLKADDKIIAETEAANISDLLFFSSKQNVYKIKAHEIPDAKASSLGEYLPVFLGLESGEQIISAAATIDYAGYMIFFFDNGKVSKINMESYKTKVNRKKLIKAFSDKCRVVYASYIKDDTDFIAIRDADKASLFNTGLIPSKQTRDSVGIQAFLIKKNSKITNILPAEEFKSVDIEYYRIFKIPSSGHFLKEDDKKNNNISGQLCLF